MKRILILFLIVFDFWGGISLTLIFLGTTQLFLGIVKGLHQQPDLRSDDYHSRLIYQTPLISVESARSFAEGFILIILGVAILYAATQAALFSTRYR